MKKLLFVVLGVTLFSAAGLAQKGNNHVNVGVEAALPVGDAGDVSSFGFGGTVKGLYGVGTAGQVTLTTGYLTFPTKKEVKDALGADKITNALIPVLAGYRHNFSGFFAEPQIGYSFSSTKIKGGLFDSKDNSGAFTWAAGVGYLFDKVEVSARYQSAHKDGASSGFIGARVAYNF